MPERRGFEAGGRIERVARVEAVTPATVAELEDATDGALGEVEGLLGKTSSFEEWVLVTDELDSAFFEGDGVLAQKLIDFDRMSDDELAKHRNDAETLIRQTGPHAARLQPLVHRLIALAYALDRKAVIAKMSVDEGRRTLIGLLERLDHRLGAGIWTLELSPELPASVIVSDPFDATPEAIERWAARFEAKFSQDKKSRHDIFSLSREATERLAFELENIHEQSTDTQLAAAASVVLDWLNDKKFLYDDPSPHDFQLYHLGHENPEDLMAIMRSLDVIKHRDPELFLELIGVDPSSKGKASILYGSFLHKALFNTQKAIAVAEPRVGDMVISSMMRQLTTLDDSVQTYAGIVSQESLKAMADQMRKEVDTAPDAKQKAGRLVAMAVPFVPLAIDAEVRRQLDALREANVENIEAELDRYLSDIEHPLKAVAYLASMPQNVLRVPSIRTKLSRLFGDPPDIDGLPDLAKHRYSHVVEPLYARIPLVDETKDDLGFGLRVRIAARDAVAIRGYNPLPVSMGNKSKDDAVYFLNYATFKTRLAKEELAAVRSVVGFREREMLGNYREHNLREWSTFTEDPFVWLEEEVPQNDRPFFLGQYIVHSDQILDEKKLAERLAEYSPDQVYLSILAHPEKGVLVAMKLLPLFMDLVPAERLAGMLRAKNGPVGKLMEKIPGGEPSPLTRSYIDACRGRLLDAAISPEKFVEGLREMFEVQSKNATPWTFKQVRQSGDGKYEQEFEFDMWQVYEDLYQAFSDKGLYEYAENLQSPDKIVGGHLLKWEFFVAAVREAKVADLRRVWVANVANFFSLPMRATSECDAIFDRIPGAEVWYLKRPSSGE